MYAYVLCICVLCVVCCVLRSLRVFLSFSVLSSVSYFWAFCVFSFLFYFFLRLFGSDFWRHLGGMDGYAFERGIGKGYTFIPTAWLGRIQLTIDYLPFNGHNTCERPP